MSKNRKTNLLVMLALAGLLIWNAALSYAYYDLKQNKNPGTSLEEKPISQTQTNINTDFTKIVADNIAKSVGVTTKVRNQAIATGSGVIFKVANQEAIIVTNNHVVEDGTQFDILFANQEVRSATLIGKDEYSDLAALKVTVDFDIAPFRIGDSALTKIGEWVLAIGSPLGQEFYGTVTPGIISGKDRLVSVDLNRDGNPDWDMLVLQTSAAINPGNSGGPLINLAGELIGINSMKISGAEIEGMAFAVPINEVITIVNQLLEHGKVIRPVLGISGFGVDEIPAYLRNYYGIPLNIEYGIFVSEVSKNGPAALAGITTNDILISFDKVALVSFKEFRKQLYSQTPGSEVEIEYLRNGEKKLVKVILH